MNLIIFSLIFSVLLESTLITIPVTLLIILFAGVTLKNNDVFILALFSGLFLDILNLGTIGLTSAFFVLFVVLIFLYQKKFEIESLSFVSVCALLGSFVYLFITHSNKIVLETITAVLIMSISFYIFKKRVKKFPKYA